MTSRGYVVLGDVVASREIDDRASFRETVRSALAGVNDDYADDVEGEFGLVKGVDEIAGVLRGPGNLYRILVDVVSAVRPGAIRFAVVYGEIDVGTAGEVASEMDGPGFHRADETLEALAGTDLYLAFDGRGEPFDPLVSASVNLLLMARERWTERQRTFVRAYEETDRQEAVAERFGVSQQTVSATLQRADWPRLARMEAAVNDALEGYAASETAGATGASECTPAEGERG